MAKKQDRHDDLVNDEKWQKKTLIFLSYTYLPLFTSRRWCWNAEIKYKNFQYQHNNNHNEMCIAYQTFTYVYNILTPPRICGRSNGIDFNRFSHHLFYTQYFFPLFISLFLFSISNMHTPTQTHTHIPYYELSLLSKPGLSCDILINDVLCASNVLHSHNKNQIRKS